MQIDTDAIFDRAELVCSLCMQQRSNLFSILLKKKGADVCPMNVLDFARQLSNLQGANFTAVFRTALQSITVVMQQGLQMKLISSSQENIFQNV